MQERAGFERPSTLLRNRGSFMSPGERVYAAVPAVLGAAAATSQPPNRLGLARWLVSDENPLTARVTVNRLWEALFGRGLVQTQRGLRHARASGPTHPELLDWLAVEFMEKGWSQKAILRDDRDARPPTASRRAATPGAAASATPTTGCSPAAPRFRVEAEMVRDVALAASRPAEPEDRRARASSRCSPRASGTTPTAATKWETSAGEDRYRRSLYTFIRRSSPYPSLMTFDAPSREQCTVRRVRTNTPLQALTTLNDPVFVEAARALARRMAAAKAGPSAAERDRATAYRLCTARRPGAGRAAAARGASTSARRRASRPIPAARAGRCWRDERRRRPPSDRRRGRP